MPESSSRSILDSPDPSYSSSLPSTIKFFNDPGGSSYTSSLFSGISRTSSEQRKHANEAFSHIRNLNSADGTGTANAAGGGGGDELPEEWRSVQVPSIKNGDWRTFGPVEVRVWQLESVPKEGKLSKALKGESSSLCNGTLWVTKVSYALIMAL